MAPPLVGQTITIMDKSGKIISTSKTLFSVFREAKTAYLDKKAEISSKRQLEQDRLDTTRAFGRLNLDDGRSVGSRGSRRHRSSHNRSRSQDDASRSHRTRDDHHHSSSRGLERSNTVRGSMTRRHTHASHTIPPHGPPQTSREVMYRSNTSPGPVDMDLAYGEIPPPLPTYRDSEIRNLFSKANFLLDEANCVQHSASAMISGLQKNPEAMAAVALTLAEISQVVSKVGPAALAGLKGSFPAIFALLASPQFLIAAGVGVGLTVVAFGGYKIIKQIRARNSDAESVDELEEITPDVRSIDSWRRGIMAAEAESVGTSVDGEFITPAARNLRSRGGMATTSTLGPPPTYTSEIGGPTYHRRGSDWESVHSHHSSHSRRSSHSHSSRRDSERRSERGSESGRSRRSRTDREAGSSSSKKKKEKEPKKKRGLSLRRVLFKSSS